jgi:lipoyl(octanoyl) transferase
MEAVQKPLVEVQDWGQLDYGTAWDRQDVLFNQLIEQKKYRREHGSDSLPPPTHYFVLCGHPHVYTLGKSGDMAHLLVDEDYLKREGISFYHNNRGGDITYHGPGQIVGYPILDLDYFFTDLGKYLRLLEETIIRTLKEYGIEAGRSPGETGVWLEPDNPLRARKICAIGIRCSRWVVMHGFAFNIGTDLKMFDNIIPCGIRDKKVASMHAELGYVPDMEEVKHKITHHFAELFGCEYV